MTTLLSRRDLALVAFAGWMARRNAPTRSSGAIRLPLRTRVELFKGSDVWEEVRLVREIPVAETAVIICDMWDKHWCAGATRRVDELVRKMAPVVDRARERGIQIIHSPSETMEFYKHYPQRRRMLEITRLGPPAPIPLAEPKLPIDDTDGGCDTLGDAFYTAWKRQHPGLTIGDGDVISDQGSEVYGFLWHKGIGHLLVMGVHTNMCILNRTFAIKQMTRWGIHCILVRDLTDTMYDPKDWPFVSHDEGTELVVRHIEKHWCPSTTGGELLAALRVDSALTGRADALFRAADERR
jgi:nicotinamidase-related amidase